MQVSPGQRALSLLPPWHVYERTVEYHILSQAASIIYSSVTHFKRDLASYTPHFLCCVPLLLDRLHARVLSSLSKLSAVKSAIAQLLVSFSIAHIKVRTPPSHSRHGWLLAVRLAPHQCSLIFIYGPFQLALVNNLPGCHQVSQQCHLYTALLHSWCTCRVSKEHSLITICMPIGTSEAMAYPEV